MKLSQRPALAVLLLPLIAAATSEADVFKTADYTGDGKPKAFASGGTACLMIGEQRLSAKAITRDSQLCECTYCCQILVGMLGRVRLWRFTGVSYIDTAPTLLGSLSWLFR